MLDLNFKPSVKCTQCALHRTNIADPAWVEHKGEWWHHCTGVALQLGPFPSKADFSDWEMNLLTRIQDLEEILAEKPLYKVLV